MGEILTVTDCGESAVDEPRETTNPIRKLYGEGREEESRPDPQATLPLDRTSEMQHVAGSVLRRGSAQANAYDAELVVVAIARGEQLQLEGVPGIAFGLASTSDDDETIALALRGIAHRLERA